MPSIENFALASSTNHPFDKVPIDSALNRKESSLKILVVGGAGYIGSHTARVLRKAGLDVVIYDNLSTGFEFLAKGFPLVVGDIHDRAKLLDTVKQSDAIMDFAANHYVG